MRRLRLRQLFFLSFFCAFVAFGLAAVFFLRLAGRDLSLDAVLSALPLFVFLAVGIAAVAAVLLARRLVDALEEMRRNSRAAAAAAADDRGISGPATVGAPAELAELAGSLDAMLVALRLSQRETARQGRDLEGFFAGMSVAVVIVDSEGRVLRLNRAAERLFGVLEGKAQGKDILAAIRNSDLAGVVARTLADGPVEEEIRIPRSGNPLYLHIYGDRMPGAGGQAALVALVDVTRQRRLEQVRQDFVANVSHELKTPVTAIVGFAETLEQGALADAEHAGRFVAIIGRQARRLAAIIEDLLTLAQIDEGRESRLPMALERMAPLLEEVVEACSQSAAAGKIRVSLDCPHGLALLLNHDMFVQAVTNLLHNAVQYSPEGSEVKIAVVVGENQVCVRVLDQGMGIAREHLERIFERFYRVDRARSRKSGGTGLGLAIVKHIVQLHQGHVAVESRPGRGSTFSICLPQKRGRSDGAPT